ncbi:hypothetical protein Tco_0148817 [Tanacetum coccineum]
MESQSDSTQTVSSLKLPMLKTGDYDLLEHEDRAPILTSHIEFYLFEKLFQSNSQQLDNEDLEQIDTDDLEG